MRLHDGNMHVLHQKSKLERKVPSHASRLFHMSTPLVQRQIQRRRDKQRRTGGPCSRNSNIGPVVRVLPVLQCGRCRLAYSSSWESVFQSHKRYIAGSKAVVHLADFRVSTCTRTRIGMEATPQPYRTALWTTTHKGRRNLASSACNPAAITVAPSSPGRRVRDRRCTRLSIRRLQIRPSCDRFLANQCSCQPSA